MITSADIRDNIVLLSDKINDGVIGVKYTGTIPKDVKIRVFIVKGDERYTYRIQRREATYYPLQCGNGKYDVSVKYEVQPNLYANAWQSMVDLNMSDSMRLWLASNVNTEFYEKNPAIIYAKKLTQGLSTQAKIEKIWEYITANYSYDYGLASSVKYDYIPDINDIFQRKKSICFGLTALFNSMLRSVGVPCKMVHGYVEKNGGKERAYHAWSEIYFGAKWQIVDVTYDMSNKKKAKLFNTFVDYEPIYFY